MTTEVQCSICGRLIDSTTVTKKTYKKGDVIDYGCPYDGAKAPLRATSTKKATKKKSSDEDEHRGTLGEGDFDEPESA